MKVYKLAPQGFAANTYFVTEDERTAVAVDPAQPRTAEEAEKLGLRVEYVLLTHGHFDHIGGCAGLQQAGAKVGCLKGEEDLALHHHLGAELGYGAMIPPFAIDFTFRDGDMLSLCGVLFEVIATPGHTGGSCCFRAGDILFSGDTLFRGGVGRTDLPTGSSERLKESLVRLCQLGENFFVRPGHGEDTTFYDEKMRNGWLKGW